MDVQKGMTPCGMCGVRAACREISRQGQAFGGEAPAEGESPRAFRNKTKTYRMSGQKKRRVNYLGTLFTR
jgi:hypothetical protein